MNRRPGVREVAAVAGVSHQTVSRVLNDHPSVTPATRKRVSDAIAGIGYVVNNGARALRSGRARMIAILVLPDARTSGVQLLPQLDAIIRSVGSWSIVRFLDERDDLDTTVVQSTGAIADGAIIMCSGPDIGSSEHPSTARAGTRDDAPSRMRIASRRPMDIRAVEGFVREVTNANGDPRQDAARTLVVHADMR